MKDTLDLVGRIFISFIFLYEVYDSIAYYSQTKITMTEYGITWQQDLLLIGTIVFLIFGSLTILIGYFSRLGSFLLLCYLLAYTFIVFSFWNDPESLRRLHALQFMRNIAVCGGLLLIISNGSGKYSVNRMLHVLKLPNS